MAGAAVSLDDKYVLERGRIYLTGTQALVRLAIEQRAADRRAGLNTAGYVTGYRGSPLGGLDKAFGEAARFADAADIRFQAGLNEDIAATAVLGTQQINLLEPALKQGVFSMWYGKGPGVDRSGDAFRHGNLAGSAPHGGVLLLAGDDHTCKSSTTAHQSEYALMDAMIPTLNPAGVQEILSFGLMGWALSRYSGCWAALKLVADTVDSSASIALDPLPFSPRLPTDFEMPAGGVNMRWPDSPPEQERRLHDFKLPAALAFARANRLDRVVLGGPRRRLGIVTTGKSYLDVRQALEEIGLTEAKALELGLSIYKVGMVWPLEPEGLIAFATGLDELLIVEEKRPLLEGQVKDILFNLPSDLRPRVFGKRDGENRIVLPAHGDLDALQIARAVAARILPWLDDSDMIARIAKLSAVDGGKLNQLSPTQRTPYFCSGCPHNTSTRVPEGSRALAGIGCHYMVQAMDRNTATFTQMGGEGANWIGQAPFVPTPHVFQNLGDGTYFHSGLLAIRAAIAAKVNITYKILYNDATAMTGGQGHDGVLNPQRITHQLRAEGIDRIAVVSDDIGKYSRQEAFAPRVSIHPREELDEVQRMLREIPGASALVYDQVCAAEKRRRKKRSDIKTMPKRVFINEMVCEGCGDCSAKSNCLSVVPVDTEWGRKRRIDQSTCNEDFSCVNGFCPSFVTVEGAPPQRKRAVDWAMLDKLDLPEPAKPALTEPWNVLVTGVGGTGVITIGAILGMAAHIENKGYSTLDMAGMAQKGGPVTSHLRFARSPEDLSALRIPAGGADLVLGCDLVVAAGKEALSAIGANRTRVIVNSEETITGAFIRNVDFRVQGDRLQRLIRDTAGSDHVESVNASALATRLLGDSIGANLFMVGYAWQRGLLPLEAASIDRAIALNSAAVAMNRSAFRLGRLAAVDSEALDALSSADEQDASNIPAITETLDKVIVRRVAFLTDYQNSAYAKRYADFVAAVQARETEVAGKPGSLTDAVARSLFKLMAYKDEYEVARLYGDETFRSQLRAQFGDAARLTLHLAPPFLSRPDPVSGEPRKRTFGPWIFTAMKSLARLKRLRGTRLDPFGYAHERKVERALIENYRARIGTLLPALSAQNLPRAVEIATVAQSIRGYGPVKARSIAAAEQRWAELDRRVSLNALPIAAE